MPRAMSIIAEIAELSPDPSVRLRASRFLVTSADRFHEIDRLRAGVRVVRGNFQEEDD